MAFAAVRSSVRRRASRPARRRCGSSAANGSMPGSRSPPTCPSSRRCRCCATPRPAGPPSSVPAIAAGSRLLDPYGLLLRNGFWYVLGRDHGHDEQRTYRVDRIEGDVKIVEPRPARSTVPRVSTPATRVPDEAKHFGVVDRRRRRRDGAGADLQGRAPCIVERELGSERVRAARASAAGSTSTCRAPTWPRSASWVLGLVDHAEVLAPPRGSCRHPSIASRRIVDRRPRGRGRAMTSPLPSAQPPPEARARRVAETRACAACS